MRTSSRPRIVQEIVISDFDLVLAGNVVLPTLCIEDCHMSANASVDPLGWVARLVDHNPATLFCIEHRKDALTPGLDADTAVQVSGPYRYDPAEPGRNAAAWGQYAHML